MYIPPKDGNGSTTDNFIPCMLSVVEPFPSFGERIKLSYNKVLYIGCCGFFALFGRVLKVVLPNVSPVSVAGIFRGQHSVIWTLCAVL